MENQLQNRCKITVKFKNSRLIFHLDNEIEFEYLIKEFENKIKEMSSALEGFKGSLEFKGRMLLEVEKNIVLNIIKRNAKITVEYIYCNQIDWEKDKEKEFQDLEIKKSIPDFEIEGFNIEEGVTKFHKGTLRSGNRIEFLGNVVVFGDLNPGAIVEASGNVIVFGKIAGNVYAGTERESKAVIVGMNLNPVQLKIGEYIAKNPNQGVLANKKSDRIGLEIALVKDGKITIESYDKNFNF
ncbi:MAG: septum site-determining protein MinC [Fusobacteriaceae bacterium]